MSQVWVAGRLRPTQVDAAGAAAPGAVVDGAGAADLGGKANGLLALERLGLPVPPFLVVPADVDVDDACARALVAAAGALGDRVAVRSSADVEDGTSTSYAGQFDTFLDVEVKDVVEMLRRCRASATGPRVAAYQRERGLTGTPRVHVVLQQMVHARVAGVCFTSDPSGARGEVVVVAARGLGTGVVDGTADTQTSTQARAGSAWVHAPGLTDVVTDAECDAIAGLARRVEQAVGRDVDVEWALDPQGRLFALQARPITTLPEGGVSYFDRSNVGENYPGLTLPLTFSHLKESYEHVFRNVLLRFGVRRRTLQREDAALQSLLGYVDGRVAYNTAEWYRLFRFIPGVEPYLASWREMLGVDAGGGDGSRGSWNVVGVAETALRTLWLLLRVDAHHRTFLRAFDAAYMAYRTTTAASPDTHGEQAGDTAGDTTGDPRGDAASATRDPRERRRVSEHTLIGLYRGLNAQLLDGWEITLANDAFAFMFSSVAKRLLQQAGVDDGVFFGLLADDPNLESVAPLKALLDLGARLATLPDAAADLRAVAAGERRHWRSAGPALSAPGPLGPGSPERRSFDVDVDAYLAAYGDRCADELKLESRTFRDDPRAFARALLAAADSGRVVADVAARERATHQAAQAQARAGLRGRPLLSLGVWLSTRLARRSIRWREASRLRRTRAYGAVRHIFVTLGERLADAGAVDDARDVFFLTTHEVLAFINGTAVDGDLRAVVERRRAAHTAHALRAPREKFRTKGMVGAHPVPSQRSTSTSAPGDGVWRGVGCAAGIARGPVVVVTDPMAAPDVRGRILVAATTDPGWIFLMAAAAGVIVERGSMLSHAAIVGRELGIPTVVGIAGATAAFADGVVVDVDGGRGEVRLAPQNEGTR